MTTSKISTEHCAQNLCRLATDAAQAIPFGECRLGFSNEFDATLARFMSRELIPEAGRWVVAIWDQLPRPSELTENLLDVLATAAAGAWPVWYSIDPVTIDIPQDGFVQQRAQTAGVARQVYQPWLQRADAACRMSRLPRVAKSMPAAREVQQLGLALGGRQCRILLAVRDPEQLSGTLYDLSRKAEWLAQETDWPVLVLLPQSLRGSAELEAISYDPLEFDESSPEEVIGDQTSSLHELPPLPQSETLAANTSSQSQSHTASKKKVNAAAVPATRVVVNPIIGRPHPRSSGEQMLWEALQADPQLTGLFGCNQPVQTTFGSRFLADFLWAAGSLIVEVDGYHWHSNRFAFSEDRRRDYELQLSGHFVMRIPHDEVLFNVHDVVQKIRRCVQYRYEQNPSLRN